MLKKEKYTVLLSIVMFMCSIAFLAGCGSSEEIGGTDIGENPSEHADSNGNMDQVKLTYASYMPSEMYIGKLDQQMFERIEKQSEGMVTTELYFDGTLVNANEWREELLRGTADIVEAPVGSERDRYELEYAVGMFNYGMTDLETLLDFTRELTKRTPELVEMDEEVIPISRQSAGQSWVHTVDHPIRSADDFKGLNLKVADDASAALIQSLGANPIHLPISETYVALETGTIDGVVTGADPLITFKFAEVTNYNTRLPYATPWLSTKMMNREVFDNLPQEYQQVIVDNGEWLEEQLIVELDQLVQSGIELALAEGNEIIDLSPEAEKDILDIMEKNAQKTANDLDADGLNGTEIYKNAREIIDQMSN